MTGDDGGGITKSKRWKILITEKIGPNEKKGVSLVNARSLQRVRQACGERLLFTDGVCMAQ